MHDDEEMLAWAKSWHWPRLVLSETEKAFVSAGESNWRTFVATANAYALAQAWHRIDQWQQLAEKKGA